MPSDRANHIIALAARLEEDDVLWDEVDLHVADFPGWSQVVQMWRTPARNPNTRIVSMGSPKSVCLRILSSPKQNAAVLQTVWDHPGDDSKSPAERAIALRDAELGCAPVLRGHTAGRRRRGGRRGDRSLEACKSKGDALRTA